MTTSAYTQMLIMFDRLSPADQQQLLAELAARVQQQTAAEHRVTEFRGTGKANPIGIDAQEHVNQERDAWLDKGTTARKGRP